MRTRFRNYGEIKFEKCKKRKSNSIKRNNIIIIKRKKFISLKTLNNDYEIIRIIQGTNTKQAIKFNVLIRNLRTKKYFKAKLDNNKLKSIAPILLCEYYENHILK